MFYVLFFDNFAINHSAYFCSQQAERSNGKRKGRGFASNNTNANNIPLFPRLLPSPYDHERSRRRYNLPLATHHSINLSLGRERHKPANICSDQ